MSDPQTPLSGGSDPSAELERLRAETARLERENREAHEYITNARQIFETISPYEDEIRGIVEDERLRELYRTSKKTYERMEEERKPKFSDPAWDPTVNPYVAKIDEMGEVVSYVKSLKERETEYAKKQEQTAQEEVTQKWLAESQKIAEGLIERYPSLAENEHAGINAILAYSVQAKMSFADAAAKLAPTFREAPDRRTPPPSLRPEMGAPGVPGKSTNDGKVVDMNTRFQQILAKSKSGKVAS